MLFSAIIVGNDIKAQLKPFSARENIEWHDVTRKAIGEWRKCQSSHPATFEEFLRAFYGEWKDLPPTHWEGIPLKGQVGYIRENGKIRVMYYGNLNGYWSWSEAPGDEYQNFFRLMDGSRSWRSEAGLVDIEGDIREAIEYYRWRWRHVRKEVRVNPDLPLGCAIMQSGARLLKLDAYVEKRVCQTVAPDIFIHNGECHNFKESPSWKTLEAYREIIRDLAKTAPHTVLTCIGLHT